MEKLHFSIRINAPKEKVWDSMLGDATFRQWTEPFHAGSHFIGSWDEGSDIKFLAPNDDGTMEGMVSRIKENRPHEFISIEHLGVMTDGQPETPSQGRAGWTGALENYTFTEAHGVTELTVDADTLPSMMAEFEQMWPKALQKLKELAEN